MKYELINNVFKYLIIQQDINNKYMGRLMMNHLSIPTTDESDIEAPRANRDIYFNQLEDGSGKLTGIIQVDLSCSISSDDEGSIAIITKEDLIKQLKELLCELESMG